MRFRADRFLAEEAGGDVFLVDQESGESWRIGGSGGAMWAALVRGEPVDVVADRIAHDTGADAADVRDDLDGFLSELVRIGALVEDAL